MYNGHFDTGWSQTGLWRLLIRLDCWQHGFAKEAAARRFVDDRSSGNRAEVAAFRRRQSGQFRHGHSDWIRSHVPWNKPSQTPVLS